MEYKFCKRCQQAKPTAEFYRHKSRKDGLQDYCSLCSRELTLQWKKENPSKSKRPKNYYRDYLRKYRATGKGKIVQLKRRAYYRGTEFNIEREEFIKWFDVQDKYCYYCGRQTFEYNDLPQNEQRLQGLTVDRKDNNKPYTINNIAIACGRCNLMKGSWLTEEQMLDAAKRYFHRVNKGG